MTATRTTTTARRTGGVRTPAARKPAPRKPAARQAAPRKPVARQPVARQPVVRKPAARKPAARQPVSRSAPPNRRRRQPRFSSQARLGVAFGIVVVIALALAARVVWVGFFDADTFIELGKEKRQRVVAIHELRGSILDRNGEALVMSEPTKLIAVDPRLVRDPDSMGRGLARLLKVPAESLVESLELPDSRYSIVARQVTPDVAGKIVAERKRLAAASEAAWTAANRATKAKTADAKTLVAAAETAQRLRWDALTVEEDPRRVAVNGNMARSVVGSMDRYATTALSGIEKLYDRQLRPTIGREEMERGIGGATIPGSERVVKQARPGSDVTLTIDRALQFVAEEELARQVGLSKAKGGTVIVGRPQTGEILAMASAASVDGKVVQGSLNQAIRLYEPGSVMKIATISTAIDMGLVTPQTTLVVPYSITLYDRTIRDSHHHPTEVMTVQRILAESSNVGTIKIAQMVEAAGGRAAIIERLHAFGFGKETTLGLPKEQAGVVKTDWNGTDIASIPIGQSITVSPVQMWTAYNVIANGGLYVPPKLVSDVVDSKGRHSQPKAAKSHRVVSSATAAMVTTALQDVVDEGTGKKWRIPGFKIAAKTGTAYKVLSNGRYSGPGLARKYASSFVGFFPASAPEITIMVMIDEPTAGNHSGAEAAGPVFDALAKESMRRFGIPGDDETTAVHQRGSTELIRAEAAVPTTVPPTTLPPTTVPPTTVPAKARPVTTAPKTSTDG